MVLQDKATPGHASTFLTFIVGGGGADIESSYPYLPCMMILSTKKSFESVCLLLQLSALSLSHARTMDIQTLTIVEDVFARRD